MYKRAVKINIEKIICNINMIALASVYLFYNSIYVWSVWRTCCKLWIEEFYSFIHVPVIESFIKFY